MQILGFDPGNSEATLTWRQGAAVRHLTIPSFVGSGRLEELRRVRSAAGSGGLRRDEVALTYHGASHFVGQLAIDESRDATAARNDVSRYWNGHALRLLLALAAQGAIAGDVRIMTGLPVSAWTAESKRLVQQSLIGEHVYTVNGKDRVLSVDAVGVMMEGAAVLASAPLVNAPQAVIDIGGRTTDLFWSQGVRPVAQRCHAADLGVERAGDLLRQEVLERHQRELTDQEVRQTLRQITNLDSPAIYNRGKPLVLNGALDAALSVVGEQIVSYISARWGDDRGVVASEAARVVLIGGGAYYFKEELRRAIPHLEVPKTPELANALGYLAIGLSASEDAWARNRG
jgi:hypothetical protein